MKNIYFLIISFFYLTFISYCADKFEPDEIKIDNSYEKRFKIISKISIQENENAVLKSIADVDISDNKLYVLDYGSGNLTIYNINSGKLINILKPEINLSDSVCVKSFSPYFMNTLDYNYIDIKVRNHKRIIPLDRVKEMNQFNRILIDENIYLLSTLRTYCYKKNKANDSLIANTAGLVEYDKNLNLLSVIPFANSYKGCPIAFDFIKTDNDEYYVVTSDNIRQYYQNKLDSLPILGKYNNNGDFLKITNFLDDKLTKSYIGYGIDYQISLTKVDNDIFIATPYTSNIVNVANKNTFNLINLPFSNDKGFEYLENNDGNIDTSEVKNKYLLFPVRTYRLFTRANSIIAISHILFSKQKKGVDFVQEYSIDGTLIQQGQVEGNINNAVLQFIHYNKNDDLFYFFRKDNSKGWTMEVAKWE